MYNFESQLGEAGLPVSQSKWIFALQLETELSSLVPDKHASIEDYLSKFRSLVSLLKERRNTKSDNECIFLILSKLKGAYQIFSSFYSTMDALGV